MNDDFSLKKDYENQKVVNIRRLIINAYANMIINKEDRAEIAYTETLMGEEMLRESRIVYLKDFDSLSYQMQNSIMFMVKEKTTPQCRCVIESAFKITA